MKRALKWLLPALVAVEAVLVWSGPLELRDAVIVIVAVEVLRYSWSRVATGAGGRRASTPGGRWRRVWP